MYSNSILTEGIVIAQYLLFFRYLLEYCLHQNRKSLILSSILVFVMVSTRKQMFMTLAAADYLCGGCEYILQKDPLGNLDCNTVHTGNLELFYAS